MIVAQLVERSRLTPVNCCSNPLIGKFYLQSTVLKDCIGKTKIKKNMPGKDHFESSYSGTMLDELSTILTDTPYFS